MARLVVVTSSELAPGFQLAGAPTVVADDASAAAAALLHLIDVDGEHGVIAVHEPLLDAIDRALRRRLDRLAVPLVVALPAGTAADDGRAERLADLLARAVGFELTFDQPSGASTP